MKMPLLVWLAATPMAAWCQTPVISRVVNSASYQATLGATGSIVSIFGTNLAAATAEATSVPLPLQLGGTSVAVGGVAAPLFYVSPSQINFQTPGYGPVVVTTAAGSSAPYDPSTATPDAWAAGGIFTMNGTGCGQGAVLNVAADGSLSVNSSANSASPGDWISVYGTGLTSGPVPLNVAAPSSPLWTYGEGELEFDLQGAQSAVGAAWIGSAPGFVGLDQSNVQIPATVREGCAVPLQAIYFGGGGLEAISQPVAIGIRQGGSDCVDPPEAGYGQITWQKNVSTAYLSVVTEADTLTVSLQASPGQQAPPTPAYSDGCPTPGSPCDAGLPLYVTPFGPACAVPGYNSLEAGTVTMQGPGLSSAPVPSLPFQQGQLGGLSAYQATLPNGAIQAGSYTVAAGGGADVGAFQASLQVGADIQVQTPLVGLDVYANCAPLTINWTGGDPNSWVTVNLFLQIPPAYGGYEGSTAGYQTRTSNGTMTIPLPEGQPCTPGAMAPSTQIWITIEVDPDPSEITPFSATGLSLGGQATWRYIHSFEAFLDL